MKILVVILGGIGLGIIVLLSILLLANNNQRPHFHRGAVIMTAEQAEDQDILAALNAHVPSKLEQKVDNPILVSIFFVISFSVLAIVVIKILRLLTLSQ